MAPMAVQEPRFAHARRPAFLAFTASLILHGLILFVPAPAKESADRSPARLEAKLAGRVPAPPPSTLPSAAEKPIRARPSQRKRLLAPENATGRREPLPPPLPPVAVAEDMDRFLSELEEQARSAPTLAERSLAMARGFGRQATQPAEEESELLERLPDSPPVSPFSLEMYLDSLVKKLNRSAAFVNNDPRAKGMRNASVLVRINPNGSLKSFRILNAGDQQDEIAYIKSVVERALPFSTFPADLQKSARSLGLKICILPSGSSGSGIGFSRAPSGREC